MTRVLLLLKAVVLIGSAAVLPPLAIAGEPKTEKEKMEEAKLAKEAPALLVVATRFAVGPVGEDAGRSETELALRALVKRPDAKVECMKLVEKGTPVGQIYGLLGLKLVDEASFKKEVARFRESKVKVTTEECCVVWERKVGELAKWIEDGSLK